MAGFWELPAMEQLPKAEGLREAGSFRHVITHHQHTVRVFRAVARRVPAGYHWRDRKELREIPLSTIARKALRMAGFD